MTLTLTLTLLILSPMAYYLVAQGLALIRRSR